MAATETTPPVMQFTYVVRAAPTRAQHARLDGYLRHTRQLYNAALQERIDSYARLREQHGTAKLRKRTDKKLLAKLRKKYGDNIPPDELYYYLKEIPPEVRKGLTYISNAQQARELTELRREPEFAAYPRRLQRWTINLVEAAYRGMFTRYREGARGKQIGFPHFRGAVFWNTIGWDSPLEFTWRKRGLHAAKSLGGTLRLRPDRELPLWERCTAIKLVRDGNRWFAHLTYKVPVIGIKTKPRRPVGIDIGLIQPVMRSDGVSPDLPRQSDSDTAAKRACAKALAVCRRHNPKRSKRKQRLRARLRQVENRIARRRRAQLHLISARLTHHFDAIAVENLNLRGLNRGGGSGAQGRGVRKAWRDRSPGVLLTLLEWKTQRDGRPFVRVDPRGTSIECSQCGTRVPKRLRDREHCCMECGVVLDRDHNAALNVLARAGWSPGSAKPGVRGQRKRAVPGAGLDLKHGSSSAGPRRVTRPPPSPFTQEHSDRGRKHGQ